MALSLLFVRFKWVVVRYGFKAVVAACWSKPCPFRFKKLIFHKLTFSHGNIFTDLSHIHQCSLPPHKSHKVIHHRGYSESPILPHHEAGWPTARVILNLHPNFVDGHPQVVGGRIFPSVYEFLYKKNPQGTQFPFVVSHTNVPGLVAIV